LVEAKIVENHDLDQSGKSESLSGFDDLSVDLRDASKVRPKSQRRTTKDASETWDQLTGFSVGERIRIRRGANSVRRVVALYRLRIVGGREVVREVAISRLVVWR